MNPPPEKSEGRRSSKAGLIVTYAFSAACLVALVWLAGRGGLERLAQPNWWWLAAALGVTVLFAATAAWRFDAVLDFLRSSQRPGFTALIYATSFGMTSGLFLTPGLGQVMGKPGLLKNQEGLDLGKGVFASLVERLLDLFLGLSLLIPILVKLALPGEPFGGFNLLLFFVMAGAWALVTSLWLAGLLAWFHRLLRAILRLAAKLPLLPRRKLEQAAEEGSWHELAPAASGGADAAPALWTIARTLAMSARLWCLSLAFGLPIGWEALLLGAPLVIISMLLAVTPGSLGFLDAGWLVVLTLQGVPTEATLTFLVALRLTNYIFLPLITLGLLAVYRLARRRS